MKTKHCIASLIAVALLGSLSTFTLRAADEIQAASPKNVIFAPKPEYPLEARRRHLTGSGILILHIDAKTGNVTSIDIEKSIGYKILDDAAIRAFHRWRFKPGTGPKVRLPIRYTMDQSLIPKPAQ